MQEIEWNGKEKNPNPNPKSDPMNEKQRNIKNNASKMFIPMFRSKILMKDPLGILKNKNSCMHTRRKV